MSPTSPLSDIPTSASSSLGDSADNSSSRLSSVSSHLSTSGSIFDGSSPLSEHPELEEDEGNGGNRNRVDEGEEEALTTPIHNAQQDQEENDDKQVVNTFPPSRSSAIQWQDHPYSNTEENEYRQARPTSTHHSPPAATTLTAHQQQERKSLWKHTEEEVQDEDNEDEEEDSPQPSDYTSVDPGQRKIDMMIVDEDEEGRAAISNVPVPAQSNQSGDVLMNVVPDTETAAEEQIDARASAPPPMDERDMDESMLEARRQSLKIKEAADEASRKLYEIKMEEYKLEEVLIITGKHPEYAQASKKLDDTKQQRLKQSSDALRLSVRLAEAEYQAAMKAAYDTFHASARNMKVTMTEWIAQKKYRLMAEYFISVQSGFEGSTDDNIATTMSAQDKNKRKLAQSAKIMMDAGYPSWVKRLVRRRRRLGEPDVIVPPSCRGLTPAEQEDDIMCIRLLCAKD